MAYRHHHKHNRRGAVPLEVYMSIERLIKDEAGHQPEFPILFALIGEEVKGSVRGLKFMKK